MLLHLLFYEESRVVRGQYDLLRSVHGVQYTAHCMARNFLIAANWKMHDPPPGWSPRDSAFRSVPGVDVLVFPSFLHLAQCRAVGLSVGAQCGRSENEGAFTGDISMAMLRTEGCISVLCGHSERRAHHGETQDLILAQVRSAYAHGLHPILCIGETAEERAQGRTNAVLQEQTMDIDIPLSIAYEPRWAIGTGQSATMDDIRETHAFIRSLLPASCSASRILYGGSANPTNARTILSLPNVDGLLVGTASLQADQFREIVSIALSL